jgi:hypothetical protein
MCPSFCPRLIPSLRASDSLDGSQDERKMLVGEVSLLFCGLLLQSAVGRLPNGYKLHGEEDSMPSPGWARSLHDTLGQRGLLLWPVGQVPTHEPSPFPSPHGSRVWWKTGFPSTDTTWSLSWAEGGRHKGTQDLSRKLRTYSRKLGSELPVCQSSMPHCPIRLYLQGR